MLEEKTYSQMRADFANTYKNYIIPTVTSYEKNRKFILFLTIIIFIFFILLGISFFVVLQPKNIDSLEGLINLGIFLLSFFAPIWIKKDFESDIKNKIMQKICKCFGNFSWSQNYCFDKDIYSSKVVPYYTSSKFDDVFMGEYKNINIDIVESKFKRSNGKSSRTVFDGVIIKLKINKNFKGHTAITPKTLLHIAPSLKLKHTILEDIEFEKKFDVYTNDEVEARYLITPSFIERLNNLEVAFCAKTTGCAFYQGNLYIALQTSKDLFSLCSLFKPLYNPKQYFVMFDEILSIIKLIDYFKLDKKIGL